MFEHLVRDGTILFLAGVTMLTKGVPALRLRNYSTHAVAGALYLAWIMTVLGFVCMVAGVVTNSW